MRRSRMICLPLLALFTLTTFAAIPAAAQELVIGFLEPPVVNDRKPGQDGPDKPGVIRTFGWVLATSGVKRVVIQVDGTDIGQATYGLFRPQIEDLFPGFPDSAGAGFGYNLNGTEFLNDLHRVTAKIVTNAGTTLVLPAVDPSGTILPDGVQEVFWSYSTTNLHPFGEINDPPRNTELFGTCDRLNPVRRYSPITGWALDLGIEDGDSGVGYVELLLDGSVIANSRIGCRFNLAAGGFTDCYGLPRLDIERRYPYALDAPNAGFRFAIDVGFLIDFGWPQGHQTLTVRVGDISNQVTNVAEVPVFFSCVENLGNEPSFGKVETPRRGELVADLIDFVGWALDGEGVSKVELFVDGTSIGEAAFGVGQGTRPAVLAMYPGYPDAAAPVWRLLGYDTNELPDGVRQLQVRITDVLGEETLLGSQSFRVDNAPD